VLLGIGLAAFELGDYKLAQEDLGRLVVDRKLGSAKLEKTDEKTNESVYVDNENYWEAWYKLLKSNVELYKKNKNDEVAKAGYESAQAGLKRLYVQGDVGGQKWKDEFDALRAEIIPDFDPAKLTAPATQPLARGARADPKPPPGPVAPDGAGK
jgi:hypothetical protein